MAAYAVICHTPPIVICAAFWHASSDAHTWTRHWCCIRESLGVSGLTTDTLVQLRDQGSISLLMSTFTLHMFPALASASVVSAWCWAPESDPGLHHTPKKDLVPQLSFCQLDCPIVTAIPAAATSIWRAASVLVPMTQWIPPWQSWMGAWACCYSHKAQCCWSCGASPAICRGSRSPCTQSLPLWSWGLHR